MDFCFMDDLCLCVYVLNRGNSGIYHYFYEYSAGPNFTRHFDARSESPYNYFSLFVSL